MNADYIDPSKYSDSKWTRALKERDAEIERLKVFENEVRTRIWNETVLENELYKARNLITELADALELPFDEWIDQSDLIQRAREAA